MHTTGLWRALVVLCFLLSGATGLLYEIIWSRYLHQLIGSSGYAHTVTLATFMAGLGLGYHLFGRQADRWARPLALYAWLELGIGAYGLAFGAIFAAWTAVYIAVGTWLGPFSVWITPLKLILGAAVMVFPAVLMGGTLPALSRWLIQSRQDIGKHIGALYFINTAGAVLGCWLGGFVVLEWLGLSGAMMATAAINIAIGVGLLGMIYAQSGSIWGRWEAPSLEDMDEDGLLDASRDIQVHKDETNGPSGADLPANIGPNEGDDGDLGAAAEGQEVKEGRSALDVRSKRRINAALIGSAIGGGLAMLYELVWIRLVGFVFGSSTQSFSVMLVTFIGGMALGGLAAGWWMRKERDALRSMAWCEVGIAVGVLVMVPVYERFPYLFALLKGLVARSDAGFAAMKLLQVSLLALVMLIPTTLMGMALPLATREVADRLDKLGGDVGKVFAINVTGTLIGASATGLLILPLLGLQWTLYLGIVSSAVLGLWLLHVTSGRGGVRQVVVLGAVLAAMAGLMAAGVGKWDPILLTAGFFRHKKAPKSFQDFKERYVNHKLLYARDGQDTTVTVFEVDETVFLKVNGKTDASTLREDMVTQMISGHLPMLIHPGDPKNALVIGLGSGVTAGSVLRHPDMAVDIVELSQSVAEGARHFGHVNHNVLDDPRATMHIGDAKDFLLLQGDACDPCYDVIISEPSNPWISGVANLFSVDFFGAIERNLAPDGVYVQWLQLYAFSDEAFARSVRSLRSVFPEVTVWRFTPADALIVASRTPFVRSLDSGALERRMAHPPVASDLGPEGPIPLADVVDLLSHQVLSAADISALFTPRPPYNTDEHPYLEFEAPRAMFRGDRPRLLDEYDRRRVRHDHQELLVWRYMERVTPQRALALSEVLERSGQEGLAKALRLSARTHLPVTEERVRSALERQEHDVLFAQHMARLMDDAEGPDAEGCALYLDQLARRHLAMANVWLLPSDVRLMSWTTRCAQAHPDRAPGYGLTASAALYGAGQARSALKLAQKSLKVAGQEADKGLRVDLLRLIGRAALDLRDPALARTAFETILTLKPGDKESRRRLGR